MSNSDDFLIKGTAILNLKKYLVARTDEVLFLQLASMVELKNPKIILPSTWYPIQNFIKMQELAAEQMKMSYRQFCIEAATYILEEDLNGVYKFFIRVSGVSNVLSKMPQMVNAYVNFIDLSILENSNGLLRVRFICPAPFYEWYIFGSEGAIQGIINVCKRQFHGIQEISKRLIEDHPIDKIEVHYELKYS